MTNLMCFWCQGKMGEIDITPEQAEGKAIPPSMIGGYDPCEDCLSTMEDGIVIIEVSMEPLDKEQPPITVGDAECYPTGRYAVFDEKDIPRVFTEAAGKEVLKQRKALVPQELFSILLPGKEDDGKQPH